MLDFPGFLTKGLQFIHITVILFSMLILFLLASSCVGKIEKSDDKEQNRKQIEKSYGYLALIEIIAVAIVLIFVVTPFVSSIFP